MSCSSSDRSTDSDIEDDNNFDGWESDEEAKQATLSLFEDKVLDDVVQALQYDKREHEFDLRALIGDLGCDELQTIRLINWIRKTKPSPTSLAKTSSNNFQQILEDDQYLQPVIADDPLLQIDFEDLETLDQSKTAEKITKNNSNSANASFEQLKDELQTLRTAYDDLKEILRQRIEIETKSTEDAPASTTKSKPKRDDDSGYFASYAENEIHEIMIKDKIRTEGYRNFILQSKDIFEVAIVLDVGCGTGILSMFAAEAGAKHVYAVDASDIAQKARFNVIENRLEQKITVIQGKVEDISLPVDKVDIIVSEWMGYFLLYESMLDSVLHARDRFLRPGGHMVPACCEIKFALANGASMDKRLTFWDDIYGYRMSALKENLYSEAQVDFVEEDAVSPSDIFGGGKLAFDLSQMDAKSYLPFSVDLELEYKSEGAAFPAIVAWFDTEFSLNQDGNAVSSFTTRPGPQGETHWKQTIFHLEDPLSLQKGDKLKVTFKGDRNPSNIRELEVSAVMTVNGHKHAKQQWFVR